MTTFERVWQVQDGQVASGRIPGYVAALRIGDDAHIHAGGHMAIEPESPPMAEEALFRIASVTKPIGGALTLSLVQDGVLALDDPIARWLPELERPRVLVAPDAPLDRTTVATRPVTVRDLLTCTSGWGISMADTPSRNAMLERGVHPGPMPRDMTHDEFIARIAALPLSFQPGDGWLYDTGIDILGVLLARATGTSLGDLFAERITGPLGMTSTGFFTSDVARLTTAYMPGVDGLDVLDPVDGAFTRPPVFESLSGGLVSCGRDLLRFYTAMADGGAPVLSAASLARMTSDALDGTQRAAAQSFIGAGVSWGLATSVDLEAVHPWMAPGRWGWDGGTGTGVRVDPTRDLVAVVLTQRAMQGPLDGFDRFWSAAAAAAEAGGAVDA